MFTLTGNVPAGGSYLVTGMPVDTKSHTVLKLAFENNTAGANVALCAGTAAQLSARTFTFRLSDSGGPGFKFLTIIDANLLSGLNIYVLSLVGTVPAEFTLTVD
jgi:hypothetical protein